jgi:hypothetical protein
MSIDPATARDLDDALSCVPMGDGTYEVGVHIADVAHYVKEGSALDAYARCLRQTAPPSLLLTRRCAVCGQQASDECVPCAARGADAARRAQRKPVQSQPRCEPADLLRGLVRFSCVVLRLMRVLICLCLCVCVIGGWMPRERFSAHGMAAA